MLLLIGFAFLAGVVTILSPCILPLLPIILSSSDKSRKQKPFGVVVGFVTSFTFFTLFLSTLVRLSGIPADSFRFISIFVLAVFGLSLLVPAVQTQLEIMFSRLAALAPSGQNKSGFFGGVVIGLSLGLLWTPCVGPILASVISLALTGTVTLDTFFITLAYALGTAVPMLAIMMAGSTALRRVPWLLKNTSLIQKAFGVLMILVAISIFFNFDRRFQTFVVSTFPKYGTGLTQFENRVSSQLAEEVTGRLNQPKGVPAPELIVGGEWFNSQPLQLSQLKGKVVLVDFWTYTCINCQRTFPYLRKWWEEYQKDGLVIIGVHSPEFEFEKKPSNVKKAIEDFKLSYPVMQDNNFATWTAYQNNYWPAKYLIDKDGLVRYVHFGEGDYDETESMIQELLRESGATLSAAVANPEYRTYSRTPELYLGSDRIEYLASPEKVTPNAGTIFTMPKFLPENEFAYLGTWQLKPEFAAPSAGSQLILNFESQEVFLVARPKSDKPGKINVYLDGVTQFGGEDAIDGVVTVESDDLYKLIKLPTPGKHTLRLEFPDGNVELYAFTFG